MLVDNEDELVETGRDGAQDAIGECESIDSIQ